MDESVIFFCDVLELLLNLVSHFPFELKFID